MYKPVSGKVIELVSQRKGDMLIMEPKGDMIHLEFTIPSRGIIGLRNKVLTATAGEAIMNHRLKGFEPWKGTIPGRIAGVLISKEKGPAIAYSIDRLQDRGKYFVEPGDEVYEGMVIGIHSRENDLTVNALKGKQLTNVRASGTDEAQVLTPPIKLTLEQAMEFIDNDELVEVTPASIRIRKRFLTENERKRMSRPAKDS